MTENEAYNAGRAFERHQLRQKLEHRLNELLDPEGHGPLYTNYRITELRRVIALLEC